MSAIGGQFFVSALVLFILGWFCLALSIFLPTAERVANEPTSPNGSIIVIEHYGEVEVRIEGGGGAGSDQTETVSRSPQQVEEKKR